MIESTDRYQRPATRAGRDRLSSASVRDELARLRGRSLGVCATCGQPVFVAQSFTRSGGRVRHVRCAKRARLV